MRQHKPGAGREGRLPWAPGRQGEGAGGRIVDLADATQLPQRYRLELLEFGRRFPREAARDAGLAWDGEIVDDYLDGERVYPEPPRRSRPVDRFGRLLDRATGSVWFFVLLACLQAGVAVAGVVSPLLRPGPGVASLMLHVAYVCALTLLPAGVLIWRADAWRSARLVLAGAIVWTTMPSVTSLASSFVALAPPLDDRFGPACRLVMGAATALACLGPVAMAFGLARVRRSRLEWLGPLAWRATAAMTLPALYGASRWLSPTVSHSTRTMAGGAGALDPASSIAGAVEPVELVGLAILACLCLSAVLAEEPQSRLWQCATAGTVLLLGAGVYQIVEAPLAGWQPAGDLQIRDWYTLPAAAALVGGVCLILLAFTSAAWSAARDAAGEEPGAPDEVFTWGPSGWDGSEPIPMESIVAVAAGADHALALDRRGRVAAWGDDSMGQTDVPNGLSDVVAVAAGDGFSLALRSDGKVVAWGANDLGQTSVPDDLAGVTAIAAGRGFALALRSDGTIVGWGDVSSGVLPVPAGLFGVTAISAGAYHALALRLDGTVVAWGDNSYGQSRVPSWLPGAKAISAGGDFSLALLADGRVLAWGDNSYGQLDVPEGLANVTAISAGAFHAVALLARGDVVGWGGGHERGEGGHPWRLVDFKAVAAGDGFSLAVRAA
jgi:hypothetical protein